VLAGLVGTTVADLRDAITSETCVATTMCPDFAVQATADSCAVAADRLTEIAGDEAGHAAAYTIALRSLTDSKVGVPRPPTVDPVVITARTPACIGPTQVNLMAAMHGEACAYAYAKYTACSAQAARHAVRH